MEVPSVDKDLDDLLCIFPVTNVLYIDYLEICLPEIGDRIFTDDLPLVSADYTSQPQLTACNWLMIDSWQSREAVIDRVRWTG